MKKYPKEVKTFIEQHVKGTTTSDLVELVNAEFGPIFTNEKMKAFKHNHKLKSGTPSHPKAGSPTKLYSKNVRAYITKNHDGISIMDMTDLLNETFGKQYTYKQIGAFYKNNKIRCGVDCKFQKGGVPQNKGRKGYHALGSEKGWFRKGNRPINHKPVGTEVIQGYGYTWVKVDEPNVWMQKHRLIWEEENGKVPEGSIVTFLDGNKQNITLENLALITKAESLELTRSDLRSENAEFTETGILIVKVKRARVMNQKKKDPHSNADPTSI
jgi:hypothetical protein